MEAPNSSQTGTPTSTNPPQTGTLAPKPKFHRLSDLSPQAQTNFSKLLGPMWFDWKQRVFEHNSFSNKELATQSLLCTLGSAAVRPTNKDNNNSLPTSNWNFYFVEQKGKERLSGQIQVFKDQEARIILDKVPEGPTSNPGGSKSSKMTLITTGTKEFLEKMLLSTTHGSKCKVYIRDPKLRVIPSLDELDKMTSNRKCIVENFMIKHDDFGSFTLLGYTDVFDTLVDEIVKFTEGGLTFFPNFGIRPVPPGNVGELFRQPVRVTLANVWPKDAQKKSIKDPRNSEVLNYWKVLKNHCEKNTLRFVGYIHLTGTCTFEIDRNSEILKLDLTNPEAAAGF